VPTNCLESLEEYMLQLSNIEPTVGYALSFYKSNKRSWEESLMLAISMLSMQNRLLLKVLEENNIVVDDFIKDKGLDYMQKFLSE
jgi:hypothetical protein